MFQVTRLTVKLRTREKASTNKHFLNYAARAGVLQPAHLRQPLLIMYEPFLSVAFPSLCLRPPIPPFKEDSTTICHPSLRRSPPHLHFPSFFFLSGIRSSFQVSLPSLLFFPPCSSPPPQLYAILCFRFCLTHHFSYLFLPFFFPSRLSILLPNESSSFPFFPPFSSPSRLCIILPSLQPHISSFPSFFCHSRSSKHLILLLNESTFPSFLYLMFLFSSTAISHLLLSPQTHSLLFTLYFLLFLQLSFFPPGIRSSFLPLPFSIFFSSFTTIRHLFLLPQPCTPSLFPPSSPIFFPPDIRSCFQMSLLSFLPFLHFLLFHNDFLSLVLAFNITFTSLIVFFLPYFLLPSSSTNACHSCHSFLSLLSSQVHLFFLDFFTHSFPHTFHLASK